MKKKLKLGYNQHRTDGIVTLIASLIVLFTSLVDPKVSVIFSFVFLILYSIFKFYFKNDN